MLALVIRNDAVNESGLRAVGVRDNAAQAYTSFFFEKRAVEGDLRFVRRVIDRSDVDA
ncbi:MAG: hypothetical protein ACLTYW_02585 [Collinsella sp.]